VAGGGTSDPRIDRYLAKDRPWRDEMVAFRTILLDEGLTEALKWRAPCYAAHGSNVAILGATKDAAVLSFFKGVLLTDPEGLLVPPGDNSRSARVLRVTDAGRIAAVEPALRRLIREAVENERLGRKVDLPKDDIDLPAELAEAMAMDADLARAFRALTPGRQRGYFVQISGAKQPDTRRARIAKHRARILDGKGIHDR
jgi:uncharacterized protein YdeI (YjbR/CyaY-like superfamily)